MIPEIKILNEDTESVEFDVLVRNNSRVRINSQELQWHIFIDDNLDVLYGDVETHDLQQARTPGIDCLDPQKHQINNTVVKHLFGDNRAILYPGRLIPLMKFKVKWPNNASACLYYMFSTPAGILPTYLLSIRDGEKRMRALPVFGEISNKHILNIESIRADRLR